MLEVNRQQPDFDLVRFDEIIDEIRHTYGVDFIGGTPLEAMRNAFIDLCGDLEKGRAEAHRKDERIAVLAHLLQSRTHELYVGIDPGTADGIESMQKISELWEFCAKKAESALDEARWALESIALNHAETARTGVMKALTAMDAMAVAVRGRQLPTTKPTSDAPATRSLLNLDAVYDQTHT